MKTVLVTAFLPFGGEKINPSQKVLEMLPDEICGLKAEKLLLPVEFVGALILAFEKYDTVKPDVVVMLGQAGGRSQITPETTAKNVMNARFPDAVGFMPAGEKISADGKSVLYSTLPVDKMVKAINDVGVAAAKSDDAGAYVCNCLFYGMLDHADENVPTGFIHVPYIREQDKIPFMEISDIYKGIVAAIEAVVDNCL